MSRGRGRGRGRGRATARLPQSFFDPFRIACPGCGVILKRNGGQWHVHQRRHEEERQRELRDCQEIEALLDGRPWEDPGLQPVNLVSPSPSPSLSPAPSLSPISPSLLEAAARPPPGGTPPPFELDSTAMPDYESPPASPGPESDDDEPPSPEPAPLPHRAPMSAPPPPHPVSPAPATSRIYSALSAALGRRSHMTPSPSPAPAFFPFHGVPSQAPPLRLSSPDILDASQRFRRLCEMATLHVHLVEPGFPVSPPIEGRFVVDMQSGAVIPGLKPLSPTVAARYAARDPRFDFRFAVPEAVMQVNDASPRFVVVLEASATLPQPLPTSPDDLVALDECRCWAFYPGLDAADAGEYDTLFDALEQELLLQIPPDSRTARIGWRVARPAPSNLSLARLESGANVLLSMAASWIAALVPSLSSQWLAASASTGALATSNQFGLQGFAEASHTSPLGRAPSSWTYSLTTSDVLDGHGHLILPELDDGRGISLHRGRGVLAAWRGELTGTLCAAEFAAGLSIDDVPRCPALIVSSPEGPSSDDEDESDLDEGPCSSSRLSSRGSRRVRFV